MAAPARFAPAVPVAAELVVDAFRAVGATHLVTVPDTNLRTVLERVDAAAELPTVRMSSEDDVLGVCAGLWMAGARPVALMQQVGLFASVNTLRAFTHDQHVPLAVVAGLYGRDVARPVDDQRSASVRLCIPLLDALDVSWHLVEGPGDAAVIEAGLTEAFTRECTSVVLFGAPTA
jgi:sulfopyruvate decarboxylase TPP-binding subunit